MNSQRVCEAALMQAANAAAAARKLSAALRFHKGLFFPPWNSKAVEFIFALFAVWLSCSTVQITMLRFGIWGVIGLVQLITESP